MDKIFTTECPVDQPAVVESSESCIRVSQEPAKHNMVRTKHKDMRKRNYKRIKSIKCSSNDNLSIVHRVDPHVLPFPVKLSVLQILKNCELTDNISFQWAKFENHTVNDSISIPPPLEHLISPPNPLAMTASVDPADASDVLWFPRSYLSFFRNIPDFPVSAANQYCLDKFSELKGYLSINPPFNVEIFHNANIKDCCIRPPPSVNECIRNKGSEDLRNHLESLPKDNYQNKVNKWLGGSSAGPLGDIDHEMKEDTCLSLHYQSDFADSQIIQIDAI